MLAILWKTFFTKSQEMLRKTQCLANSELEIVAEKRPKKNLPIPLLMNIPAGAMAAQ